VQCVELAFNYFAQRPFLFVLSDGWLNCESEIFVVMTILWLLSFILTHDARFPFASGTVVVVITLLKIFCARNCCYRCWLHGFSNRSPCV